MRLAFREFQSVADLVLTRSRRRGTMAFNCFGVSGWASGSRFADAVMALSACDVGITMGAGLGVLGMVFYLSTIGTAQIENSSLLARPKKPSTIRPLLARSQP